MRAPTNNRITQGQHGTSKAVDHSASPDPTIYSPVTGVVDSFQQRGSGRSDAGLMLRIKNTETGAMHSFGHCEKSYVSPGQRVTEGQPVAKMGHTGYTIPSGPAGAHLHYYIRLADDTYIYPPSIYSKPAPTNKGGSEMATRDQVNQIYKAVLHRNGDEGGLNNYTGRDANQIISEMLGSQEFKNHQNFVNTAAKQISDLQTALKNEQNKPPKVVEKEVEKIVEKIVKVEVPAEVNEKEVVTNWLKRLWNKLFDK